MKEVRLKITGMTCASCVNNVEKALKKSDHVEDASVNLATEEAYVSFKGDSPDELIKLVENTGFGASLENGSQRNGSNEYHFQINGMTCASCVANVERAIKSVSGIDEANVNLATEEAMVSGSASVDEIISAIEKAGFEAKSKEGKVESNPVFEKMTSGFKKKFFIALPMAFVVMIMDMGPMLIGGSWHHWVMDNVFVWNFTQLILTAAVMIVAGGSFFTGAWKAAKNGYADMNTLVAVGTGSAFLFSSYATFFGVEGGVVSPMDIYFDTAAVIIALILLGKWMEERARYKSRDAMAGLIELTPQKAHRVNDSDEIETIDLKQVNEGDKLLVKAFEQVPVDGEILDDYASVEESMMTGESVPSEKSKGDEVLGGTRNTDHSFTMIATRVGTETALSRMIDTVRRAQGSKPPIQRLVDKVAAIFVPIVFVIAIAALLIWMFVQGDPAKAIVNMVAVLIIACPCALGLATPTGIMVGSGRAADKGILIKDAVTLEEAKEITTILLDKTGTLTTGNMQVTQVWTDQTEKDEILRLAGSIESVSDHPLAKAVVSYAKGKGLALSKANKVVTEAGKGIEGIVGDDHIRIGSVRLSTEFTSDQEKFISDEQNKGSTVLLVLVNDDLKGMISVSDQPKPDAKEFISSLKKMNIQPVMVTGDQEKAAKQIASELGITKVEWEVSPENKAALVKSYQEKDHRVAMVGDGINDAAALVQADLGIALSSGADLAVSSSDITIMGNQLNKVIEAISLSRGVLRIIKQNLFWAFIYNTVGIPLAAFGILSPMFAAAAMALSSVSVVSNSLRIRNL